MTKAELVAAIAQQTGIEKSIVLEVVEELMECVRASLVNDEEVSLRGFGSFIIKHRAEKIARNITRGTSIRVPAHKLPAFKPSKHFIEKLK